MKLLSPVQIGPIEVKNRVVSTAHSAYVDFYRPGCDGQRYMAYQERRAEGGTGLMIMTAMHVHPSSQIPSHFIYEPEDMAQIPRWRARVMTMTSLTGIDEGIARLSSALEPDPIEVPCDLVVAGVHPEPNSDLYHALNSCAPTVMVGDVVAPRSALEAFREGDRAGRTI